jgi:hypothetical protein
MDVPLSNYMGKGNGSRAMKILQQREEQRIRAEEKLAREQAIRKSIAKKPHVDMSIPDWAGCHRGYSAYAIAPAQPSVVQTPAPVQQPKAVPRPTLQEQQQAYQSLRANFSQRSAVDYAIARGYVSHKWTSIGLPETVVQRISTDLKSQDVFEMLDPVGAAAARQRQIDETARQREAEIAAAAAQREAEQRTTAEAALKQKFEQVRADHDAYIAHRAVVA